MSNIAIDRAIRNRTKMTPGARLVLFVLANRANGDWRCWPGTQTIAEEAGITDRAVNAGVAQLAQLGLLSVEPGGGRHKPNVYTLHLPAITEEDTVNDLRGITVNPEAISGNNLRGIATNPEANTRNDLPGIAQETPKIVQETPKIVPRNPEASSPQPKEEPIINPKGDSAKADATADADAVEIKRFAVVREFFRLAGIEEAEAKPNYVGKMRASARRLLLRGYAEEDIFGCLANMKTWADAPDLMSVEKKIDAWITWGRPGPERGHPRMESRPLTLVTVVAEGGPATATGWDALPEWEKGFERVKRLGEWNRRSVRGRTNGMPQPTLSECERAAVEILGGMANVGDPAAFEAAYRAAQDDMNGPGFEEEEAVRGA